jgi:predicted dehydrogenase
MKLRVGIVGCGLIGNRRARVALAAGDNVAIVCDLNEGRARALAGVVAAECSTDWRELTGRNDLDVVVVCTANGSLHPITIAALRTGKHVLCEKPLGRNATEAAEMRAAARDAGRVLKVGFNHRHHPALAQAHELTQAGAIGTPFCVRAAYGHGGRPGYEYEWRGDPDAAGGGELLDQGVHVIDLCRWFLGEFAEVAGMVSTAFWPVAPLEDNAFALLRTASGQTATIHTSWTQWKNLFRFEVFGRDGYLRVDGLGGSYGQERLTLGRRQPESGPPAETKWRYPLRDRSWEAEWAELASAIADGREPLGGADDGYQAALLVDAIYRAADRGAPVYLEAAA